ncbi:Dipeptide transport system permease protein DppC [Roseivivax sp. THAF40]|uniref:ABC transporter permease n=1 Tax=unclassified Roseivivax TaxID=2639302 RepID=UPI0012690C17|nr:MULTISPECIES: ABC transporter permease [unclassified Roseivivax]QFS84661.1 Dipeptide transport system permease protein DppC [Roseivivax sp. THAF197b]QFT48488.1 Dipeptide transport system permease protein DppC [Roseivivax sp. THAF40]
MSTLLWFAVLLAGLLAGGWVFRFAGQTATGNKPYFRDMPFAVAFGYVVATAAVLGGIWLWFQPGAVFFRWAVQGFVIAAISAFLFRIAGRHIGTEGTRKAFRSMPLTAAFGILVILIYAILAIFAGALAPYGQAEVFDGVNVLPGGNPATGGDPAHPLGTDQIGRDLLTRLIYGAQNTVGIAFATTCLAFFLGGSFGFLAAVIGGWLDNVLSRMVDVLMAIPSLIFALLLMTIASAWAGSQQWLLTVYMVIIIAVIDSTRVFRLARAVGQNIVVMDYIEAAKLRGEGLSYLIFKEILPNATAPLLAEFGLRFCFVFLTIAALSFLGVGIQPPLADWGTMVRDLSQFINFAQFSPLAAALPLMAAGAIALLTVAVNFVVDWMLHRSSGLKD